MLILVSLDLVSRTRTKIGAALMHWLNPAGDAGKQDAVKRYPVLKQVIAVAWIAGFATAMLLVGILYAVPLYVFLSLLIQGRRPLLVCVGFAAGATLMIWLLFDVVLSLDLYPGILFGGA
jgi:hypothetical protein